MMQVVALGPSAVQVWEGRAVEVAVYPLMAAPPLSAAGTDVQVTLIWPLPAVSMTLPGAAGTVLGMAVSAGEAAPAPSLLLATTTTLYSIELVRPLMVQVVAVRPVASQVRVVSPEAVAVAVYPLMAAPPLSAAGTDVQVTMICSLPGVSMTPPGAAVGGKGWRGMAIWAGEFGAVACAVSGKDEDAVYSRVGETSDGAGGGGGAGQRSQVRGVSPKVPAVAVYPLMASPPLSVTGTDVQVTMICPLPGVSMTLPGAAGGLMRAVRTWKTTPALLPSGTIEVPPVARLYRECMPPPFRVAVQKMLTPTQGDTSP